VEVETRVLFSPSNLRFLSSRYSILMQVLMNDPSRVPYGFKSYRKPNDHGQTTMSKARARNNNSSSILIQGSPKINLTRIGCLFALTSFKDTTKRPSSSLQWKYSYHISRNIFCIENERLTSYLAYDNIFNDLCASHNIK
jgi:hypothetical protein